MKPLFAPWRMEFIRRHKRAANDNCIFCEIREDADNDESRLVLERGANAYAVLNKFPYGHGHLLILPSRHVREYEDLSIEEVVDMDTLTKKAIRAIKSIAHPKGFNIGINIGKAAGAGIENHLHLHILPRWEGDINFMPLLAETRIIAQHLSETYQQLKGAWS